jgi:hypothetical protein
MGGSTFLKMIGTVESLVMSKYVAFFVFVHAPIRHRSVSVMQALHTDLIIMYIFFDLKKSTAVINQRIIGNDNQICSRNVQKKIWLAPFPLTSSPGMNENPYQFGY